MHGVTFDGKLVWFARNDELVAFDPASERVVRRLSVPSADSGTAFDGEHLYQLAKGEILVIQPSDGPGAACGSARQRTVSRAG